jgi:hypothetical protein
MIACDNDDCPIEWFHYECVGLKDTQKVPISWLCPKCINKHSSSLPPSSSAGAFKRKRIIIDDDDDGQDDVEEEEEDEEEEEKDDIHQLAHPIGSISTPIQPHPSHLSPKANANKKTKITNIALEERAGSSLLQALMHFHTQCLNMPSIPDASQFPLSCLKMLLHDQRLVLERLFLGCMYVAVNV